MEHMDTNDAYDWVDDDTLDLDATMGRFERLEPVNVTTGPPTFRVVSASTTSADYAYTVVKTLLGPQRQAANFA